MNWFRKGSKSQARTMGTRTMVGKDVMTNCGVHDPETCLEVFKSHWKQTLAIIDKMGVTNAMSGNKVRATVDDVEAVIHYMDQMMLLLIEEGSDNGQQGPILQYMLTENVMERINTWCCLSGEYHERLKVEQLKTFDMLITESKQQLLVHKPIIRPLLHLLSRCAEHYHNVAIRNHMILLLHQLCVSLTKNAQLLELFFSAGANHGPAKFLVFSLLIPYVHHEGHIGQQARDALLLIMALSSKNENIGRYIAENSDFCPVLATGLSGLYSSLPRKLEMPTDDWCQLIRDDWCLIPDLVMFLNSLEFCNAVVQVSHPLVRDQLLKYIYNGFLVPVLGPALHQDFELDLQLYGEVTENSLEEVIAATAYLDLFIRQITEPALIQTFLKFILIEKHDEIVILDSLITRINSNSRLCMVSLALFKTMVDLNCEEVMFQLVFKYLIPCTHVMVSQKRSLKEIDIYSKTAEKFLSLTPACCLPEWSDSPQGTSAPGTPDPASRVLPKQRSFPRFGQKLQVQLKRGTSSQASSPEHGHKTAFPPGSFGSKLEHYETNYMDYLKDSRQRVFRCAKACQCWSAPYDGENPSPESIWKSTLSNDKLKSVDSVFINSTESTGSTSSISAFDVKGTSLKSREADRRRISDTSVDSLKIQSHGQNVGDSKRSSSDMSARSIAGGISAICLPQDKLKPTLPCGLKDVAPTAESDGNTEKSKVTSSSNKGDAMLPKEVGKRSDVPTTPSSDSVRTRSSSCVSTPDDSDMSGFILMLKRVKTPVEICDNLEESFTELDSLIDDLNIPASIRERSLSKRTDSVSLPNFTQSNTSDLVRPTAVIVSGPDGDQHDKRDRSVSVKNDMSNTLCEFDTNASAHETLQTIPQQPSSTSREASPEASAAMAPAITSMPTIPKSLMPFMQDKPYNMCTPNIGPFLSVLLHKLDSLMQNTLYVNLLLTGLITRLACYPQSLLRSFILNHSLVFQPSIKSLNQVLFSVKHKIDCFSYTVDNFENLLLRGRRFLAWRENALTDDAYEKMKPRSESAVSPQAQKPKTPVQEIKTSEKRKTSISDFLFRRSPQSDKDKSAGATGKSRLERVSGGGYRYINSRTANIQDRRSEVESQKTKNAVYAAIVLEEFLKELAALSQEHLVLHADDGYASN